MSFFRKVISYRWSVFPPAAGTQGGTWSKALRAALHLCFPLGPSLSCRHAFCSCSKGPGSPGLETHILGLLGIGQAEVPLWVSWSREERLRTEVLPLTIVLYIINKIQYVQWSLWHLGLASKHRGVGVRVGQDWPWVASCWSWSWAPAVPNRILESFAHVWNSP